MQSYRDLLHRAIFFTKMCPFCCFQNTIQCLIKLLSPWPRKSTGKPESAFEGSREGCPPLNAIRKLVPQVFLFYKRKKLPRPSFHPSLGRVRLAWLFIPAVSILTEFSSQSNSRSATLNFALACGTEEVSSVSLMVHWLRKSPLKFEQ